jgi:hypothetical protein
MVVNGPINAASNHNSLNITVNDSTATFNLVQGYDNNVISTKTENTSPKGYAAFLAALNQAGFQKGIKSKLSSNGIGYCSTGDVYDFRLYNNGSLVHQYWATSCPNDPRTYKGDFSLTANLFNAQIENYSSLVENTNF